MRAHPFLPLAGLALAGCAVTPPPARIAAVAPVALSSVAVVAVPPPLEPQRPADLPAALVVPAVRADGRYATINRDLTPAAALWHVRAALNVAALGCRGVDGPATIAGYNRLLRQHKAALATADAGVRADFRARGADWQAAHDRYNTRLYNFFAQPLDPRRFCATALALTAEAARLPADALPAWAPQALARLEAPFTEAYARYDDWRRRHAAWAAGERAPQLAYAPVGEVLSWGPAAPAPVRMASLR